MIWIPGIFFKVIYLPNILYIVLPFYKAKLYNYRLAAKMLCLLLNPHPIDLSV